jgi:hypothetical protein
MTRKFDVGCCECTDATGVCCDSNTTTCSSSGEPEDRCCCLCDSAPPCEYDVTISGVADFTGGAVGTGFKECSNCSSTFNQTFTLQRYASTNTDTATGDPDTDGYCVWWSIMNCELTSGAAKCVYESRFENTPDAVSFSMPQVIVLELWDRTFTLRIFAAGWVTFGPMGSPSVHTDWNWCNYFYGGRAAESQTEIGFGILHKRYSWFPQYAFEYTPSGSGKVDCYLSSVTFTKRLPIVGTFATANTMEFGDWSAATATVSAG